MNLKINIKLWNLVIETTHLTFTIIDHVLGIKENLNIFQEIKSI